MLITNVLNTLLQNIYCLDIPDVILLAVVATCFLICLHERYHVKIWWHLLLGFFLICWAAVVTYSTISSRSDGGELVCQMTLFHSYRELLNGGTPEILRSNFMNIILFYPAGLIGGMVLPQKWPDWLCCSLVVLLLAAMSAGIEWTQYRYILGLCEIDDVFHNAMGTLLGVLLSLYARKRTVRGK